MVCSRCGYLMEDLDRECFKCHGKGLPDKEVPKSSLSRGSTQPAATTASTTPPTTLPQAAAPAPSAMSYFMAGLHFVVVGIVAFIAWGIMALVLVSRLGDVAQLHVLGKGSSGLFLQAGSVVGIVAGYLSARTSLRTSRRVSLTPDVEPETT